MHEVGHNIGLYHSNENNREYNDQSCLMGFSYSNNHEGPKMCFNGVKSWALGWYRDKSTSIDLDTNNQNSSWNGKLVGVTDYISATPNEHVIVAEIVDSDNIDDEIDNYYLLYNRQDGINSEVREFGDQVTITRGHFHAGGTILKESRESDHVMHLSVGESYTIDNYKGSDVGLTIKFCDTLSTSDIVDDLDHARVSVYLSSGSDNCSAPMNTPAPTVSPAPSLAPAQGCPSGESRFILKLQTDNYPGETSWQLFSSDTTIIESASLLQESTYYEHDLCLADGCYNFKINDDWGDGICCDYGDGWYKGYVSDNIDNVLMFEGGKFDNSVVEQFCISSSSSSPKPHSFEAPTFAPSSSSRPIECLSNEFGYEISITTDNYPEETSFRLLNENNEKIIEQNGSLTKNTDNKFSGCLAAGCYIFEIEDAWGDGMCCNYGQGDFGVVVNGAVAIQGEKFKRSLSKPFCGCSNGEKYFNLDITPDPFPQETSWELKDSNNNIVLSGASDGEGRCIPDGCYALYIYDSYGDGMCCTYGNGGFHANYNNIEVAMGGEFGSIFSTVFGNSCTTILHTSEPSPVVIDQSYSKGENLDQNEGESIGAFGCLLQRVLSTLKR